MALMLRANTAVDVLIGPFLDDADGDTEETGLTLEDEHIFLSKNGQALTAKNDANNATHDNDGYYNCPLNATDTNTEGTLVLQVHVAGALSVRHEYNILSEAAWDSMFVAKDTGYMDVNVKAVSEDTTAADNLESACDNYSVTRGLAGTALPAAAADAAGGLPISDAGGLDLDTQLGYLTAAVATATALATVDTVVDGIQTDLSNGTDGLGALKTLIDTLDGVADNIYAQLSEVDNDGTAISHSGAMKLLLAALTGKSSGGGTSTLVFRDINDSKNRISATVDADGNRTAVGTRDAT